MTDTPEPSRPPVLEASFEEAPRLEDPKAADPAPAAARVRSGPGWLGVGLVGLIAALGGAALGSVASVQMGSALQPGGLRGEVAGLGETSAELEAKAAALTEMQTSLDAKLAAVAAGLEQLSAAEAQRELSVQLMRREVDDLRDRLEGGASRLAEEAVAPLRNRLDAIEAVEGGRPVTDRTMVRAVAALQARISDLEAVPAPPTRERVVALEQRLQLAEKALAVGLASPLAAPAGVDGVAVAAAQSAARAQVSALFRLEEATRGSQPFGTAMGAMVAAAPRAVPPELRELARTGAPTLEQLRTEFDVAEEQALRALVAADPAEAPAEAQQSGWDWLRGVTGGRVVIRRGTDTGDNSPRSLLARARDRLATEDIAGAVAALRGLQGEAAAPLAPWIGRAERRVRLEEGIARLRAGVLAAAE